MLPRILKTKASVVSIIDYIEQISKWVLTTFQYQPIDLAFYILLFFYQHLSKNIYIM